LHDYAKALADADKAVQMAPKNSDAYVMRANSNSRLGNMEQCVADCTSAIAIKPQKAEVYYTRGKAYAQLQKKDQADADLLQAQKMGLQ
jgi:Flp pilus assembly protein TadD